MKEYFLEELLQIKNGRDHKHIADGEIPIYGSGGIMRYGNQSIYADESILLPRKGTLSNIQFVNEPFWTVDTIYYTIINKEKANPIYLYHYLKQLDLSYLNSGTGVPSMTFGVYYGVKVNLPSLIIQQKIASVLSTLDSKIELNNRINTELEAMAKTLYDYWFVQFDFPDSPPLEGCPQDGVAIGKPYKTSGGKMVWNAELKREIPEGWEVGTLEEIENNIITGKTPSTKVEENFGGDIPFVTIDDIRKQLFLFYADRTLTKKGADSQSNKYLQPGDICVSCIGTIGVIGIIGTSCQTTQQINSNSNTKDCTSFFLLNALKDYFNFNVAAKKGAVLDNMNKGDFSIIPILDAPNKLKIEYNRIANSFYTKIENNLKENQELVSLRDWLLPMLMNGQVSVGEVIALRQAQDAELGMVAEPKESYGK